MNGDIALPETNTRNFSTWFDIYMSARKDRNSMSGYVTVKKAEAQSADDEVNLSIARSMLRDMDEKVKKTLELTIYEYASISEEDIKACLTGRQAQVVMLKQNMNFMEIAEELGISCKTVYETYKKGILKLKRFKKRVESGLPPGLSKQQTEIYRLRQAGCKPKEISIKLSISPETVYKQLNRIKQKTMTK
jgi:DNA-binding CsgD family transcriptional regulator